MRDFYEPFHCPSALDSLMTGQKEQGFMTFSKALLFEEHIWTNQSTVSCQYWPMRVQEDCVGGRVY